METRSGSRFQWLREVITQAMLIASATGGLLLLVEIGACAILHQLGPAQGHGDKAEDAEVLHKRELTASKSYEYRSYYGWRRKPFQGKTINVDEDGRRSTPTADCGDGRYTIFFFGGSTMWGTGASDAETIPSFVAKKFADDGMPVCAVNFGESGWVSTQGVIALLQELKSGYTPDLVVFYDGANETFTPYQEGRVDVHHNYNEMQRMYAFENDRRHGSARYLMKTNIAAFLSLLAARAPKPPSPYVDRFEELARQNVDQYLANVRIVDALAKEYGFRYVFFWQPVIFVGAKPLTERERAIKERDARHFPEIEKLFSTTYGLMREVTVPHVHFIADVFDGNNEELYLDFAHVRGTANRLIADRMYPILKVRREL